MDTNRNLSIKNTDWTWPGICTSKQQKNRSKDLRVLAVTDS